MKSLRTLSTPIPVALLVLLVACGGTNPVFFRPSATPAPSTAAPSNTPGHDVGPDPERARYAEAELLMEGEPTARATVSYRTSCLEAKYEIGPALRSGTEVVVNFSVVISAENCTARPVPCEGTWINDKDYNDSAGRQGLPTYELRDAFDVAYPLTSTSGIAAQDASLACGEEYTGSWHFIVPAPVGKVAFQHPDINGRIHLTVTGG